MPQFNALSGPELLDVILAKIKEKLEDTGDFAGNISYPWVKYSFKVAMVAYPKQGMEDEPGTKAEAEVVPSEPVPDDQPIMVSVEVPGEVIDTPDLARVEAGLPIPTVGTADAAGVQVPHLVDKMVMPQAEVKRGPGRPRKNG